MSLNSVVLLWDVCSCVCLGVHRPLQDIVKNFLMMNISFVVASLHLFSFFVNLFNLHFSQQLKQVKGRSRKALAHVCVYT